MTDIIIIGGCPGAGKSTIAKQLGEHIENSVVIHTDDFFSYIQKPVDPSTPAAEAQNNTVIKAYAGAATHYRDGGYTVIIDGVIGPWHFGALLPVLGPFHYCLLHQTLEVAKERVIAREARAVSGGIVERMHPLFEAEVDRLARHIIRTENRSAELIAMKLLERLDQKALEIQAD